MFEIDKTTGRVLAVRIAIPLEGEQVADHMGHCPGYMIAEIKENTVTATEEVRNPRHGPGGPPPFFLAKLGVQHIVGWGAPEHFLGFLSKLEITYTLGAKGNAREVLDHFLAGTLETSKERIQMSCGHDH